MKTSSALTTRQDFQKSPLTAKKPLEGVLQPVDPIEQGQSSFYNLPNSPASHLIMETLGAGSGVADLSARKKTVSHSADYEIMESGKKRMVTLTSGKSSVTIELADIDRIAGSNKPAKKLFVLSLIKANERAIFNGQLTKDHISFPLQELIDIGFYKTPQSARTGFKAGMDALTSVKVKGRTQVTKKKESAIEALEVLFTGYRIEKGQCTVYLNTRINWSFIAQYFTILPTYYFRLPNRASDLLYYISYLARQHTKELAERGYFTISFRAIQQRLNLPNEVGNREPGKTIKQPIDEALEEIEEAHRHTYGNREFLLEPVCDDTASIKDYLDNGYLKVSLSGSFAATFLSISEDTKKQIEEAEKRQARITEKAVAIKTAHALEAQDGAGKKPGAK